MRNNFLLLCFLIQVLFNTVATANVDIDVFNPEDGFKMTYTSSSSSSYSYYNDYSSTAAFGKSAKAIGDVNGDGIKDFICNVPNRSGDYDKARVAVIYGRANGYPSNLDISTLAYNEGFILITDNNNDKFGYSFSGLGDVNGDGIDDFAIGAYATASSSGVVYILYGTRYNAASTSITSRISTYGGFKVTASSTNINLGFSVSDAGDVDGDGLADILIGAPKYLSNQGRAYLIYGKRGSTRSDLNVLTMTSIDGFYITGASGSELGYSVAAGGNINGDTYNDIIIGAPGAKTVYVIYGSSTRVAFVSTSSLSGTKGFSITDSSGANSLGYAVSGNGDVNADGLDDVIIGSIPAELYSYSSYSSDASPAANVFVIFGYRTSTSSSQNIVDTNRLTNSQGIKIYNSVYEYSYGRNKAFGYSVSISGDVNGDKIDDIVIGAPMQSGGYVCVVFGKSDITDVDIYTMKRNQGYSILNSGASHYYYTGYGSFGTSVSTTTDLNSDGINDIIIGYPSDYQYSSSSSAKEIYFVYGQYTKSYNTNNEPNLGAVLGVPLGLAFGLIIVLFTIIKTKIRKLANKTKQPPQSQPQQTQSQQQVQSQVARPEAGRVPSLQHIETRHTVYVQAQSQAQTIQPMPTNVVPQQQPHGALNPQPNSQQAPFNPPYVPELSADHSYAPQQYAYWTPQATQGQPQQIQYI